MNHKLVLAALIAAAPTYVLSYENTHYNEHAFEQVLNKYKNLYTLENIHAIMQKLDCYVKSEKLPQESVGWLGLLLLAAHDPSRSARDKALYEKILTSCYQHGFSYFQERKFTPDKIAAAIAISNNESSRKQLNKDLLLIQTGKTVTQEDIAKVHNNALASYDSNKARQEVRRVITLWKNNKYSAHMLDGLFSTLVNPFMYLLALVDQRDNGPGLSTKEQQLVDFLQKALPGPTQGWLDSNAKQNEMATKYGKPIQHAPWMIFSALLLSSGDPIELSNIIIEDHICDETCGITTCCPESCCK